MTSRIGYGIFYGWRVIFLSRERTARGLRCTVTPRTIFICTFTRVLPNQKTIGVTSSPSVKDMLKAPLQWPGPDLSCCPQSITFSSTHWLIQWAAAYWVCLLFSHVIYCSPHPLALQPSISTTFFHLRTACMGSACCSGARCHRSTSAVSQSAHCPPPRLPRDQLALRLPRATAAVPGADGCASVLLRGLPVASRHAWMGWLLRYVRLCSGANAKGNI